MAMYLVRSLSKIPYMNRIHMVLANPTRVSLLLCMPCIRITWWSIAPGKCELEDGGKVQGLLCKGLFSHIALEYSTSVFHVT
jgi:hypothetical protein